MKRLRLAQAAAGLAMPLLAAAGSLAFFSASGAGAAQGTAATVLPPGNVTAQQSGSVAISWSAAKLSSGGAVQGYRVTRSDGASVCGSPSLLTSLQCTDASPPAGSYTYTVTAVYNSWKASAASSPITILTVPSLTSTPASQSANTAPAISFSGGGAGVSYQCLLDSSSFTACTSPQPLKALNGNSALAAGSHTFRVHAVRGGSTGPDATYSWTINTAAPAISSSPPSPSAATGASFGFSDGTYAAFKCQLDGAPYTACTNPAAYTALANGQHTLQVQAIDADGIATGAASYSWTIDTTAPAITARPSNPSLSASASFTFSHASYNSFKCQLDTGGFRTCASPDALTGLASGWHTFQVEAVDAAGATTNSTSYSWLVIAIFPTGNASQAARRPASQNDPPLSSTSRPTSPSRPRPRACPRPAVARPASRNQPARPTDGRSRQANPPPQSPQCSAKPNRSNCRQPAGQRMRSPSTQQRLTGKIVCDPRLQGCTPDCPGLGAGSARN